VDQYVIFLMNHSMSLMHSLGIEEEKEFFLSNCFVEEDQEDGPLARHENRLIGKLS
jgi:hypothetical protein